MFFLFNHFKKNRPFSKKSWKRSVLCVVLFLFISSNQAQAFEWPEWIYYPFFDNSDNIRNKKLVNHAIGLGYQHGAMNVEPGNGLLTEWSNANSIALVTYGTLNLTSRLWLVSDGLSSFLFNSNNSAIINGMQNNIPQTFGFNSEMNFLIGYDILRFSKIDIGAYTGFYEMTIHNYATSGSTEMRNQSYFIGGVIGIDLTHYSDKLITRVFTEFYMTYLVGYQSYQTNQFNLYSTNFANTEPAMGFGVGSSIEIPLDNGFWIKPFAKLQMIFANDISTGTYYFSNISNTNNNGSSVIQILTTGLGIGWR